MHWVMAEVLSLPIEDDHQSLVCLHIKVAPFCLSSHQRYLYIKPLSRWCALVMYILHWVPDLNYDTQLLNLHLHYCEFKWLVKGRAIAAGVIRVRNVLGGGGLGFELCEGGLVFELGRGGLGFELGGGGLGWDLGGRGLGFELVGRVLAWEL
eukprot:g19059.t1